jgi:DNA-binding CsgD family transcriptional regulator
MTSACSRPPRALTPYQRQVLFLLMQGLTTKEIALRLKRHPRSINRLIGEIKRRLQAETRAQAAARAAASGLLPPDW